MIILLPPPGMTSTEMIAIVVAIASSLGTIATVVYSFRNSASGIKNDIISTYETRLSQMDTDIRSLTRKVDELTVKLDKSETERKQYLEILQGKNPELERFMEIAMKMLTDIHGAVMPSTHIPAKA